MSLFLRCEQRQRSGIIRDGNQGVQSVQQIQRSEHRHEIAQGDRAGFLEPLERGQADAALASQLDLRDRGSLGRNAPGLDGAGKA
jgi:hypothetical protein